MSGLQAALPASSVYTVADAMEYGSDWPISGDATALRQAAERAPDCHACGGATEHSPGQGYFCGPCGVWCAWEAES